MALVDAQFVWTYIEAGNECSLDVLKSAAERFEKVFDVKMWSDANPVFGDGVAYCSIRFNAEDRSYIICVGSSGEHAYRHKISPHYANFISVHQGPYSRTVYHMDNGTFQVYVTIGKPKPHCY